MTIISDWLFRCRATGKHQARCIMAWWHKGRHQYRVTVKPRESKS